MHFADAPAAVHRLSRSRLFFWLFLVATANALMGFALQWLARHGIARALSDLFGISAIVWVAAFAGLAMLRADDSDAPVRAADIGIAILVAAASLIPAGPASAAALTLLCLHAILTSRPGAPLRRAAIVFLSITGMLIWGRLLLALLSHSLLAADTWFVATLFGTAQHGNFIASGSAGGGITVAPGCSSLQGMSLAFVFWALVNQYYRVPFTPASLGWLGAALAATIALNVLRIGAMVIFPEHLAMLHGGIGWHFFAWTTLIAVAAICLFGARDVVFARD